MRVSQGERVPGTGPECGDSRKAPPWWRKPEGTAEGYLQLWGLAGASVRRPVP